MAWLRTIYQTKYEAVTKTWPRSQIGVSSKLSSTFLSTCPAMLWWWSSFSHIRSCIAASISATAVTCRHPDCAGVDDTNICRQRPIPYGERMKVSPGRNVPAAAPWQHSVAHGSGCGVYVYFILATKERHWQTSNTTCACRRRPRILILPQFLFAGLQACAGQHNAGG